MKLYEVTMQEANGHETVVEVEADNPTLAKQVALAEWGIAGTKVTAVKDTLFRSSC
jgi:hypothetical protein